ncbi:hypothetical protein GW915_05340 [bacterium]|nr:hypothetical protein [bacterium]
MSPQAPNSKGQLQLPIDYFREPDRNFEKGGRSFYFFDFDDNVVHLPTQIVLFHKTSDLEKHISTQDFAKVHPLLGKPGSEWEHFEAIISKERNSYKNFREQNYDLEEGKEQPLIQDLKKALEDPLLEWRGPSWGFFVYAVNNNRPISIITARGHHPNTIRRAINHLVQNRDLGAHPNYLSVYPLSFPEIQKELGDVKLELSTAELKKLAIKKAVQDAFECYGPNPSHRFGMSDDDPKNVELILEAMVELKETYPENAFFVINTHGRKLVKEEVMLKGRIQGQELEYEQKKLI